MKNSVARQKTNLKSSKNHIPKPGLKKGKKICGDECKEDTHRDVD